MCLRRVYSDFKKTTTTTTSPAPSQVAAGICRTSVNRPVVGSLPEAVSGTSGWLGVMLLGVGGAGVLMGSVETYRAYRIFISPLMPIVVLFWNFSLITLIKYFREERKVKARNMEIARIHKRVIEVLKITIKMVISKPKTMASLVIKGSGVFILNSAKSIIKCFYRRIVFYH